MRPRGYELAPSCSSTPRERTWHGEVRGGGGRKARGGWSELQEEDGKGYDVQGGGGGEVQGRRRRGSTREEEVGKYKGGGGGEKKGVGGRAGRMEEEEQTFGRHLEILRETERGQYHTGAEASQLRSHTSSCSHHT
eukprot:758771-Hanusia_phi.AAC.1